MTFFNQVKYDYLQRIRSYRFLIIMAVSLALGFLFIPAADATYETVTVGTYKGVYNSAWIGVVSAVMASTFVSLLGFYVINSNLSKDIDSKVGQIIATTRVSNFGYLFSKVTSNFLVLSTMIAVMLGMNVGLFFLYGSEFSFEPLQFILPYLFIPIPAMFLVANLAVVLEVIFKQKSTLQNVFYFLLIAIAFAQNVKTDGSKGIDPFGTRLGTADMISQVNDLSDEEKVSQLNIGFRLGNKQETKPFVFEGISLSLVNVAGRFIWMIAGVLLTFAVSRSFHRFDLKEHLKRKKQKKAVLDVLPIANLDLSVLPKADTSYSLWPLLKTEFLLLIRQGSRWLWMLNLVGIALLAFLDLKVAHTIILPILWFLQVSRWSQLTTKEQFYNVHQFTFAAYKPISRVYASQLIAGIALGILIALPLVLRHLTAGDLNQAIGPILGSVFIVGLSAISGIISQGKKLFEILFFFLSYGNVNGIPFLDYFAGMHSSLDYLGSLLMVCTALIGLSIISRKKQLRSL
ncbi:hypothetical protein [Roseivirga misakiensis]|uniref:Uncharacterized protein n=1 Tax=Roseivirga misakiensis TaxID=1563681 RepID=A0A1E5T568_9BACT|nr:hypothetical protein [Roseivirga misakiensis]OEK06506.1 hypothetical protein BFP71_02190 [Roseivirga misakiensis]